MATTPILVSVRTNGDGSATRKPIFKSDFIKFERKFDRSFKADSLSDGFMISFAVHHAGKWPTSDDEFDAWVDGGKLEILELADSDLTGNFTEEHTEPS